MDVVMPLPIGVEDDDDDTHFCLRCQMTISGIDNYVTHRRSECSVLQAYARHILLPPAPTLDVRIISTHQGEDGCMSTQPEHVVSESARERDDNKSDHRQKAVDASSHVLGIGDKSDHQGELCNVPAHQEELCNAPDHQRELCDVPDHQGELGDMPTHQGELRNPPAHQGELSDPPAHQGELSNPPAHQGEECDDNTSLQTFFSSLELCKPDDLGGLSLTPPRQNRQVGPDHPQLKPTTADGVVHNMDDDREKHEMPSVISAGVAAILPAEGATVEGVEVAPKRRRGRPPKHKSLASREDGKINNGEVTTGETTNLRRTTRRAVPKRYDDVYVYSDAPFRRTSNSSGHDSDGGDVAVLGAKIKSETCEETVGTSEIHFKFERDVDAAAMRSDNVLHANTENRRPAYGKKRAGSPSSSSTTTKRKPCPVCGKEVRVGSLPAHVRTHTGERPYNCAVEECGATFAQRCTLAAHARTHVERRDHACGVCAARFPRANALRRHMYVHEKDRPRPHRCDSCGRGFHERSVMRHHMKIHGLYGGKNVRCPADDCERAFRNTCELTQHMRVHTGERPFLCDECGYAGRTQHQLTKHTRCHTGERPFKCQHCEYAGTNTTHLKRHMRLHTGARPYRCPYCPYTANNQENIRKHITKTGKHAGRSVYPCGFCSYGSNSGIEFRAHLLASHRPHLATLGLHHLSVLDVAALAGIYDKTGDQKALQAGNVIQLSGKQLATNRKKGAKRAPAFKAAAADVPAERPLAAAGCEERVPRVPRAIPRAWLRATGADPAEPADDDPAAAAKTDSSPDVALHGALLGGGGGGEPSGTIFFLEQVADGARAGEDATATTDGGDPCGLALTGHASNQVLQLSADSILQLSADSILPLLVSQPELAQQMEPLVSMPEEEQNVMYLVYQDE